MTRFLATLLASIALSACASFPEPPPRTVAPQFGEGAFRSVDGAHLGLTVWRAENPRAVFIAVHGMNDYANAFALAGEWWARNAQITTYAYDQRGFGRSPGRGLWPGADALRQDLSAAIEAAHAAHPDTPLYVVGHSMGAGVVLSAMGAASLDVDGVVLAAPGVWGGANLPLAYRAGANLAAAFAPGKTLTGERAARQSTDNIEVLRAMQADPLMIGPTRIDAVLGVVRLMGEAYDASDEAGGAALVLIGEHDEIIPERAMARAARRLCGDVETRVYPEGWHLLFRDLQAETVWRDVAAWIERKDAAGAAGGAGPAASSCEVR
ncbi:MAG: alpha/beta fold hydrolase [Pseudomonadota bacterium]